MKVSNRGRRLLRMGPRAEAGLWVAGIVAVAAANPEAPSLIELCLLKAVGFSFCPGCGLGHAIGFLARGEFALSFDSHPLAAAVVCILIHRIVTLWRQSNANGFASREKTLNHVQSHQVSA